MSRMMQLVAMGAVVGLVGGLASGHMALWPVVGMMLGAAWARMPEPSVPARS